MSDPAYVQLLKAGLSTGDWSGLQHYLKNSGPGDLQVSEELVKRRHAAGCCIGCGRDPCDNCEMQSPLWCEVCWGKIVQNCPEGMVVSGLARVIQQITYNQAREQAQNADL